MATATREGWTHATHLHYLADISDMDCVSTTDFEALKAEVAMDVRNLDIAWIILCSECLFHPPPPNVRVPVGDLDCA